MTDRRRFRGAQAGTTWMSSHGGTKRRGRLRGPVVDQFVFGCARVSLRHAADTIAGRTIPTATDETFKDAPRRARHRLVVGGLSSREANPAACLTAGAVRRAVRPPYLP